MLLNTSLYLIEEMLYRCVVIQKLRNFWILLHVIVPDQATALLGKRDKQLYLPSCDTQVSSQKKTLGYINGRY